MKTKKVLYIVSNIFPHHIAHTFCPQKQEKKATIIRIYRKKLCKKVFSYARMCLLLKCNHSCLIYSCMLCRSGERSCGLHSLRLVPESCEQQAALLTEDTDWTESVLFWGVLYPVQASQLQEEQNLRLVQTRQTHRQLRRLPGRRAPAAVLQVRPFES